MRLHTLAAIITPAAKPSSAPCARSHTLRAKKNTVAAPSAVIRNVKDVPSRASISESKHIRSSPLRFVRRKSACMPV